MAKILLTDLGSLTNEQTTLTTLAANNTALRVAMEKTLSRDGTSPNAMSATLDMNSNRIINLPSPISPTDPVRLGDVNLSTVIVTKEVSFATKALAVASSPGLSVDILVTLGHTTPGDGGSAKYGRILPSSPAPYRIQTADGQWWALIEQPAKPEMFGGIPAVAGATAGSVPDCTSAIQAAVNWRALKGGKVYFSAGTYGVTTVGIPSAAVYLQGAGTYATYILHTMTAPSSCFVFSAGAAILPSCGISDLSIYSQDIVFNKIAVNISDVSVFESKNVHIGCYPLDGSNGNMYRGAAGAGIGFYIGGREHVVLENASVYANIPLELGANVNFAAISADSFFFKNCLFYTAFATNSPVLFDNGINVFNIHFDGGNWIGGKDGLHWIDGVSSIDSDGLYIKGIKLEQAVDTTGYFVNIQHNTLLKNFHLEDCIGGDRGGIKLRKVPHAKLVKYAHQQSAFEAINLDSTAETFEWNNCFFWNGSSITTTGLNRAWAQSLTTSTNGSTTIPTSAFYTTSVNPILVQNITADLGVGANTYNNVRITQPASTSTITIGSGKTVAINQSLTFSGTDGTVMTFPATTATIARTDASQTFLNNQTFSATIIGSISGNAATATNATNTTNINITDDTTTNATFYPTFVPATTGNNSPKVSSSKLGFNPSTGQLNANVFAGAGTGLTGTAASLTAGSTTTNANLTGPITSVGNATTITAAAVSYANFQNVAGISVVGRNTNSSGVSAAITATDINQILRVNTTGTSVDFGSINLAASQAVGTSILAVGNGGTGLSALGTGVVTALGIAVGSAGGPVTFNGALGTPSSGVGTNITGVNAATLGGATFAAPGAIGGGTPAAGTHTTLQANTSVNVGAAVTPDAILTVNANTVATTVTASPYNVHIVGANSANPGIISDAFAGQNLYTARIASGTAASPGQVNSSVMLGFTGQAMDNTSTYRSSVVFELGTIGLVTSTDAGGYFRIRTMAAGTVSLTEKARIQSGLSVGTTTDPGVGGILATTSIKSQGPTSGVGYATGAGGAVTQITSRTTGVTLNTVCGAITLVSALGSAVAASFTVTNSAVAATDVIHACQQSGTDKYNVLVTAVAAGSFVITFFTTGGTTTEQPVFNFVVIKGVTS